MGKYFDEERFSRHTSLKDFGVAGQEKLSKASVLVIGAGGLGCPVLQYLVASGVGCVGIADDDLVSLSNLQRQILYNVDDIGQLKVLKAAEKLKKLNPDVVIHQHNLKVTNSNALELFKDYDIIVDGTDNFATRYLVNDACVILDKPLIFAAVYQYEGHVAVFNVPDDSGLKTNYRDLFETPPNSAEAPDCNEAGVLGVLPGLIGLMQAAETIKLITGIGKPLINQLLVYNLLLSESYTVKLTASAFAMQQIPIDKYAFESFDYEWFCGTKVPEVEVIDSNRFYELSAFPSVLVVDVREEGELPKVNFPHLKLPLSKFTEVSLNENLSFLENDNIVLFCHSGIRSLKAAQLIVDHFGSSKKVYNLKGGILRL
jgi:molybdopterin/thiamine biosynthesis adenylyltransferase/rhodanese-related sulfurtransferase